MAIGCRVAIVIRGLVKLPATILCAIAAKDGRSLYFAAKSVRPVVDKQRC